MKAKITNRIRRSTKYILIITATVLLLFSLANFSIYLQKENMNTETKQIYKYTNKYNYDYKINLISNKYMTNEEIADKGLAYVTDLIDNIELNLNYDYTADKSSAIKGTYSIIGKMQAVYTKNGEEQKIWEKEETLLEEKSLSTTSNKLSINEKLILDLKDKNNLINSFKQQLGMSINAKYTVILKINTNTVIEEKEVTNEVKPSINIDLAEKTTKLSGENNTSNTEYIAKEYKVSKESNVIKIIINLIFAIIGIVILRYAIKTPVANTVRNEYKLELNRILRICQDKIVKVSTKPNDEGTEVVFVKDFGEIFKVSEELFKPILYYEEKEKEEAWFSVISGKSTYRYILKKQ